MATKVDDAGSTATESKENTRGSVDLKSPEPSRRVSILSNKTSESGDTETGGGGGKLGLFKRRNTLRNFATTMMGMRRKSMFVREVKPKPKLENTFKTTPDEEHCFRPGIVRKAIENVLGIHLKDVKYDAKQIKKLTCQLSTMIQHKVKGLGFDRHKLICNVIVGQRQDQGVHMASRCLWDPTNDNWVSAEYVNDTVFAIATVHAVYFE